MEFVAAFDPQHLIVNAGLFGLAIYLIHKARKLDRENYVLQKATPSISNMVNVFDDVWLRGKIICDTPLRAPHFGLACVRYHYEKKEKKTDTYTDSKGRIRTVTRWATVDSQSDACSFHLEDAGGKILILAETAQARHIEHKSVIRGKYRYELEYIPHPGSVSAVGSISENKKRLEARGEIPLFLTTETRKEFFESANSAERSATFGGYMALWGAFALGFANLTPVFNIFEQLSPVFGDTPPTRLIILTLASGACVVPFWAVHLYNGLVIYKRRCQNAWAQVDVELKHRHELIPQLVSVVKKYMTQEKDVFEGVIKARKMATSKRGLRTHIHAEQYLEKAIGHFMLLAEKYPELKAGPSEELFKQIQMIEDKIAFAKKVYNETVEEYNTEVSQFPHIIISSSFGYVQLPFYR